MSSSDHTPSSSSGSTSPSSTSAASSPCGTCGKRGETSPASSASKKPKTDDSDNSMTIEIDKFLECSVCLDFPSSPIHSCDNAHVLCGRCAPKLTACPTCQAPKLVPSPVAEKLAKEANKKIQCVNFEAGCKEDVSSTKFEEHLPLCYFRDITCGYNGECGVKVNFHQYTKHLEDVHDKKSQIVRKFTKLYNYNEKRHVASKETWRQWGHSVMKFQGQQFILHARVSKRSKLFFSWVSILGDTDAAEKYFCEFIFKDEMSSNEFGCSWRLPVLAFHEISSNESEAKLFENSGGSQVLVIPLGAIREWGKMEEDGIFQFGVTYEIKDA